MRTATKNETAVWYANFVSETEELDAYGNHTGRYYPTYSTPKKVFVNLAGTRYTATWNLNGFETDYRRDIVTCDKTLDWKENTVLWIGIEPTRVVEGVTVNVPHNFIVEKVSPTLNAVRYTIREVQNS